MPAMESELTATYFAAIDALTPHWAGVSRKNAPPRQPSARKRAPFDAKDLGRIATVNGMARFMFDTARAVTTLHSSRQLNAMIPLVRLAYESAMNLSLVQMCRRRTVSRSYQAEEKQP